MNVPRAIGDSSHVLAILLLIWKIFRSKSCAGISGRTQILYFIVFCTRYLDIFTHFISYYNTVMKAFFIITSLVTLILIYVKFKDTQEKHDNFRIESLLIPTFVLAMLINHEFSALEVLWTFSIYLEAVAIIPQLTLVIKNGEVESTIFYYICILCAYRAFYIVNWIWRYYAENFYDKIAITSSCVETLLYMPFFYLYHRKVIKEEDMLVLPE